MVKNKCTSLLELWKAWVKPKDKQDGIVSQSKLHVWRSIHFCGFVYYVPFAIDYSQPPADSATTAGDRSG